MVLLFNGGEIVMRYDHGKIVLDNSCTSRRIRSSPRPVSQ